MKKVFNKNLILGLIIGLSFSIVSVYAATTYLASDVKYKDTTVENALNDLYNKHTNNNDNIKLIASGEKEILSSTTTETNLNMTVNDENYFSLDSNTFTVLEDGNYLFFTSIGSNEYKYRSSNIRIIYNSISIKIYINGEVAYRWAAQADSFLTNNNFIQLNKGDVINVKVFGNGGSYYKKAELKIYK